MKGGGDGGRGVSSFALSETQRRIRFYVLRGCIWILYGFYECIWILDTDGEFDSVNIDRIAYLIFVVYKVMMILRMLFMDN